MSEKYVGGGGFRLMPTVDQNQTIRLRLDFRHAADAIGTDLARERAVDIMEDVQLRLEEDHYKAAVETVNGHYVEYTLASLDKAHPLIVCDGKDLIFTEEAAQNIFIAAHDAMHNAGIRDVDIKDNVVKHCPDKKTPKHR